MHPSRLWTASFLFLVLLSGACRKEVDEYGPTITMHTPVSEQTFNVYNNVHVTADITDETKIASVTVTLTDLSYTPVHVGIHVPVTSPSMSLSMNYTLDNIHLESGRYYLMITASDGTHDSRAYQPVNIIGVPKALKHVFVVTASGSSATNLSETDSAFTTLMPYHAFSGDYLGSSASSYDQQVFVCGSYTGAFTSYELQTNTQKFSVPPAISGNPYFTAYYGEDKRTYIGRYDGTIKGYNNHGDVTYTANATPGYYATAAVMNDNHLVAAEQSKTSPGKILVSYFTTGSAEQQASLSQDVVAMCNQDENNIFLFGNVAGQGVIQLYDRIHNNIWNPYNYSLNPGAILSAVQLDADTYLIGHSDGTIYKYQFMTSSVTAYLVGYTALQLQYDALNNRIYIAEQNRVTAVDVPSASVTGMVTSTENIKNISLLYNR